MEKNEHNLALFQIFEEIKKSSLPEAKKKVLIRPLFIGEPWSWRVSGISEQSIIVLKKNKFKKPAWQLTRHHFKPFDNTVKALLRPSLIKFEEWSGIILKGERTHIITRLEHNLKEDYAYYPVSPSKDLFTNKSRGFKYTNPERGFVRKLLRKKPKLRQQKFLV